MSELKSLPDAVHILSGLKLCVVDDSKAFAAGVGELLKPLMCELIMYNDPLVAMTQIPAIHPDIIITDYEMGEFNGIDLIRSVRSNSELNTTPILVLTSRDDSKLLIATMIEGGNAFVSKANVREVLVANLIVLARIRLLYQEIIRLKQFSAIKTMIGTYKHEFGNVLAILDGKIRKLEKTRPDLVADDSFATIKANLERMEATLVKLGQLREYQEEPYSDWDSLIKVA